MDSIKTICLNETSKNPIEIIRKLMAEPWCHIHGPEHHVMVGSALLTAYKNAGGDVDLEKALDIMAERGKTVPGAICGYWGACGAAISAGTFVSIIKESGPLATDVWPTPLKMTSKALEKISTMGGPRCCKRDSYQAILAAIDFAKDELGVEMEKSDIKCIHSHENMQCIKEKCKFYNR